MNLMADSPSPARLRLVVSALLVLGPLVAVAFSPWGSFIPLVLFSLIGALNAALVDARAVAHTTVATTAVTMAAVLLTGSGPALPVLGTALVVLLAFGTAALVPRGLAAVGAVEVILAAHLLIEPAALDGGLMRSLPLWRAALILAGVVLLASASVFILRLALLPGRWPVRPAAAGISYGAVLAVVCGLFTLACLLWFRDTNMWWTVLTAALVLQPAGHDTRVKAFARTAGTFAGAALAALAAGVIPAEIVVRVLGLLAAVACVLLTVAGSAYWMYSTAVTIAVILLTSSRSGLLSEDAQRIACTVVAATVSVAAVMVVERVGAFRSGQPAGQQSSPRGVAEDSTRS